VREGQSGRLRLDAFPWAQYGAIPATVTRVASEVRDNLVRVELALKLEGGGGDGMVQHGLPGAVEVDVERVSPFALVARAAGLILSNPQRAAAIAGIEK
jgi:membrane fusion protein (multidrug efflux system)